MIKEGTIYQAISGFYYIWADGKAYATKPRGNFRHQQVKPLVGDRVRFEWDEEDVQSEGRIIEILPRVNHFVRPPIANVDHAFVVISLVEPDFSYNLLDHFLVAVEQYHIKPTIVLTKYDLSLLQKGKEETEQLVANITATYDKAGYTTIAMTDEHALSQLVDEVQTGIHVVMGQSGVGKSTLLNKLLPQANIQTAAISDYLNRGRHTTREVTLYQLHDGLLADTPGFSALEFADITKESLAQHFPEIERISAECKFRSCLHQKEPNCAVKAAVEKGDIAVTRYDHYCQLFEKIEQRKPIYRQKKGK